MRLAILGTRGVPAAYGGFETMAEELGSRLVERGHDVTVYCRPGRGARPKAYRGMHLRYLPALRQKHLETVLHTALSSLDTLRRRFDVVLICNVANAPFALVPRLVGTRVALNVDGLEWERGKWGRIPSAYFYLSAWLAARMPVAIVSDARYIASWYERHHHRGSTYIPYGSDGDRCPPGETMRRLGLGPEGFILYVSRFEPENNAHTVIQAYATAGGIDGLGMPLVMVGDAPYASGYRRALEHAAAGTSGVVFTGSIYGPGYVELQSNAAIYIQATEVGGTHPALVEAMSRGRCILANDVPEHREVLGQDGCFYRRNDPDAMATALTGLTHDQDRRHRLGDAAASRAERDYSWKAVTDKYERLFIHLRRAQPRPDALDEQGDRR